MIAWLAHERQPLPPASQALGIDSEAPGLLAAGGDLTPLRLAEAYGQGVFPWYSEGQPVLWWSPDPRMVLHLDEFRISRSLAATLRRARRDARLRVTLDSCFERVMRECSMPRASQDGTWITREMLSAYGELHRIGAAHSVEVWEGERLAGGLYGVALGRMFYGESMFTRARDASKAALCALVQLLRRQGFRVIDCQQNTRHLASFGAREIARASFLEQVAELVRQPGPDWRTVGIELPDA